MDYTYEAGPFRQYFEENFTWTAGFLRSVRKYPDSPAMIDPQRGKTWTYAQLYAAAQRLAAGFQKAGVSCGDVVLYQLYNSAEFALCYVAPQLLGAVNSPVNFNLSAGETARLLDRDRPKVYIYDRDFQGMAVRALELCTHKPALVLAVDVRGNGTQVPEGHCDFQAFLGQNPEKPEGPEPLIDIYTETTRFCTSGTTGTPKGVPVNHVNEVLTAHENMITYGLRHGDVTMNMTPWFHRGGLHLGGPCPTFYAGACLVILRMFSPKQCFEYVQRYGVTFLIGVPSALTKLAARQEKHPVDLSHLRGIITMGSPLQKQECRRFQQLLTEQIFNGYGTTETFFNSMLYPETLEEKAGSAGLACNDDEIRVVAIRENDRTEPEELIPMDGTTRGEVIIRPGGQSALTYLRNPEETQQRYYKGWYYTRDIATWDREGYITICGRRDDMIVCMGENIFPAQVEAVLEGFEKVQDSMVVGVSDVSRGQAVAAYVIPADPDLTVRELNRFCVESDELAGYMCPRYYVLTDTLPYTSNGKKQHARLRKQAEEDLAAGKLLRP